MFFIIVFLVIDVILEIKVKRSILVTNQAGTHDEGQLKKGSVDEVI